MTDSVKTPPRPMGSDMSMDDILLSIRKIIATEETKDVPPVQSQQRPQQAQAIPQSPVAPRNIPQREELNQISNLSYDENARYQQAHQASQLQRTQSNMRTPVPESENTYYDKQNSSETSEILKTLEDIKRSLSPEAMREAKSQRDTYQQEITPQQAPVPTNELRKINVHNNQDAVDLRPAQFDSGEIPDFLKKFKRETAQIQQESKASESDNSPIYDFSQLSSFDEDDSVMELTKVVLPEEQEEENNHNQQAHLKRIAQEFSPLDDFSGDDGLSDAMEMLMIKSLRPMLQEWIDENLTVVAEKIIREELMKKRYKK